MGNLIDIPLDVVLASNEDSQESPFLTPQN